MVNIHKDPDQKYIKKIHKTMEKLLQTPLTNYMIVLAIGKDGKPHGYYSGMRVKDAHALICSVIAEVNSQETNENEKPS